MDEKRVAKRMHEDNNQFDEMARIVCEKAPLHYDDARLIWAWKEAEKRWVVIPHDERLINHAKDHFPFIDGDTINKKQKILDALYHRADRSNVIIPAKHLIQYKNGIIDIYTGEVQEPSSKYFFVNPIPWDIGMTSDTPVLDKLFTEWVGKERVETLYDIIAYCTYRGYPLSFAFAFVGGGRNGKSTFMRVLEKFLGHHNIAASTLHQLVQNKNETYQLVNKLACFMPETSNKHIDDNTLFKQLTGEDLIRAEKKYADTFMFKNYAKILITSNALPPMTDNTDGNYRRWLIIDFPNQFPEGEDMLAKIPDSEYEALAKKCVERLPRIIDSKTITGQGTTTERRHSYLSHSMPILKFIEQGFVKGREFHTTASEFNKDFSQHQYDNHMQVDSAQEVNKQLLVLGYERRKTTINGDHGVTIISGIARRPPPTYEGLAKFMDHSCFGATTEELEAVFPSFELQGWLSELSRIDYIIEDHPGHWTRWKSDTWRKKQ